MFHVRNDQQDMLVVSLMANVNLTLSLFVVFFTADDNVDAYVVFKSACL